MMLVLQLKVGGAVLIVDHIRIEVVRVGRHNVRLGITAPGSMRIDREEVRRSIERDGLKKDQQP